MLLPIKKMLRSLQHELDMLSDGEWESLQFDQAVVTLGMIIENAVAEMVQVGPKNRSEWRPKYEMAQLLDSAFRLPRPPTQQDKERASLAALKSMARRGGTVRYAKVKP